MKFIPLSVFTENIFVEAYKPPSPSELMKKVRSHKKKSKSKLGCDSDCMQKFKDKDGRFKGHTFNTCVEAFGECCSRVDDPKKLCAVILRKKKKKSEEEEE